MPRRLVVIALARWRRRLCNVSGRLRKCISLRKTAGADRDLCPASEISQHTKSQALHIAAKSWTSSARRCAIALSLVLRQLFHE